MSRSGGRGIKGLAKASGGAWGQGRLLASPGGVVICLLPVGEGVLRFGRGSRLGTVLNLGQSRT